MSNLVRQNSHLYIFSRDIYRFISRRIKGNKIDTPAIFSSIDFLYCISDGSSETVNFTSLGCLKEASTLSTITSILLFISSPAVILFSFLKR